MEPISLLVGAVAAGASAALKDTVSKELKSAYGGVRSYIAKRFSKNKEVAEAIEKVEKQPDSKGAQMVLKGQLLQADFQPEEELKSLLQALVVQLENSNQLSGPLAGANLTNSWANFGVQVKSENLAIGSMSGGTIQVMAPQSSTESADDTDALSSYLEWIAEEADRLDLQGVEPSAPNALGSNQPMRLGKVYIDLATTEQVQAESQESGRPEKMRPKTAREAFSENPCLVLLGDPGGGKSTFVRFLCRLAAQGALDRKKPFQEWPREHEGALPILVVLRDLAPELPDPLPRKAQPKHLLDFLASRLEDASHPGPGRPSRRRCCSWTATTRSLRPSCGDSCATSSRPSGSAFPAAAMSRLAGCSPISLRGQRMKSTCACRRPSRPPNWPPSMTKRSIASSTAGTPSAHAADSRGSRTSRAWLRTSNELYASAT